ncbi:MAG: endonuclease [Bacteroidota bacterium]
MSPLLVHTRGAIRLAARTLTACALVALLGLVISPATQAQTVLYPGLEGQSLVDAIRADFTPANTLGYGPARDSLYAYEQREKGAVCGIYTQYCIQLTPGADPSTDAFGKNINAEHTYPQSLGAGSEPARSDMHSLFPARANVNSSRSNHPFAEIPDDEADAWYRDAASQSNTPTTDSEAWSEKSNSHPDPAYSGRFEPREGRAGDVARAVFYFYAIYPSADASFFAVQKDDLVQWHYQDPADQTERDRSAWIAVRQGGENPFVLDSTLARRAFGLPAGGIDGSGTLAGSGTPSEPGASPLVWVNEVHYDNNGPDTGEGIEVAGPAGTDLTGYTLALYNGDNGTAYRTVTLAGVVADQQGGYGTVWFPVRLQNGLARKPPQGSPDGLALVDPDGGVLQFLSYEGTLTATRGPASGMTSTDLGVEQGVATPAGYSLQVGGSGNPAQTTADDFVWETAQVATPGMPNANQMLDDGMSGWAPPSEPGASPFVWVNEVHYDNNGPDTGEGIEVAGPAGTDLTGYTLALYNGDNGTAYRTVTLAGVVADQQGGYGTVWFPVRLQNGLARKPPQGSPDGLALVDPDGGVLQFLSYEGTLTATRGPASGMTSTDLGVEQGVATPAGYSLQVGGSGNPAQTTADDFVWEAAQVATPGMPNANQTLGDGLAPAPEVVLWINELHYDNSGADRDEGVEVAGTAGADLTGYTLALYNGNGGAVYQTRALSGTLDAEGGGLGAAWFAISGLQNGSPDGLALVDPDGAVLQFLSYEGTLTAIDGSAVGLTSTDIGVQETSGTQESQSLQLVGTGTSYADFTWAAAQQHTRGSENRGQTFGQGAAARIAQGAQPADASVYPNPATTTARLVLDFAEPEAAVQVEVFDLLGRRLMALDQVPHSGLDLDVRGWVPGVYIVRARSEAARTTLRFTVSR